MQKEFKPLILSIDFDGTCVRHAFPEIGEPIPGAFETLKALKKAGHKLILWTCRTDDDLTGSKSLTEAVKFCKKQGFTFDAVNSNLPDLGFNSYPKIYADYYIDDRNFGTHVINWELIAHTLIPK